MNELLPKNLCDLNNKIHKSEYLSHEVKKEAFDYICKDIPDMESYSPKAESLFDMFLWKNAPGGASFWCTIKEALARDDGDLKMANNRVENLSVSG